MRCVACTLPQIADLMFYAAVIPGIEFLHKLLQRWQPPPLVTILFAPLLLMIQIVLPTLGHAEPESVRKPARDQRTPPPKPPRPSRRTEELDTPPSYPPPPVPSSRRRRSGSSRRSSPLQAVMEARVQSISQTTVFESDRTITQYTETSADAVAVFHQEEEERDVSRRADQPSAADVFSVLRAPATPHDAGTPLTRRQTLPPIRRKVEAEDGYRTPQRSDSMRAKRIEDSARRLTQFSLHHNLRTPSSRELEGDDEDHPTQQRVERKEALSPESLRDKVTSFMDLTSPAPNTLARRRTRQSLMESGGALRRTERGIPDLTASRAPKPDVSPSRASRAQQLRDMVLRRRHHPPGVSPSNASTASSVEPSPRTSRRFSLSRKHSSSQDDKKKKRAWL